MILDKESSQCAAHYLQLAEAIAKQLENRLCNKLYFRAKAAAATVRILNTSGLPSGHCCAEKEDKIELNLEINEDYRPEMIEMLIAHEFAHLLFATFDWLSDYCERDNSFSLSGLTRSCDGKTYGVYLEEAVCDWIAVDVVYHFHNGIIPKEKLVEIFGLKHKSWRFVTEGYRLIERMIKLVSYDGKASFDFYDSMIEADGGKKSFPANALLYGACSRHLNWFIYEYDKYNGNGSWKRLNEYIDTYLEDISKTSVLKKIELELEYYEITGWRKRFQNSHSPIM